MNRGVYVVFEGGEGSGTTTMTARATSWFETEGVQVRAVREPGETVLGTDLREVVKRSRSPNEKLSPLEQLWLFSADRASLFHNVITPLLEEGVTIVSDRSVLSTWAYQVHAGRMPKLADPLRSLTALAAPDPPDLCFVLNCSPEIGLRRAADRGEGGDAFEDEDIEYHKRVARGYRQYAHEVFGEDRILFVNTEENDEDGAWELVQAELERRFKTQ